MSETAKAWLKFGAIVLVLVVIGNFAQKAWSASAEQDCLARVQGAFLATANKHQSYADVVDNLMSESDCTLVGDPTGPATPIDNGDDGSTENP